MSVGDLRLEHVGALLARSLASRWYQALAPVFDANLTPFYGDVMLHRSFAPRSLALDSLGLGVLQLLVLCSKKVGFCTYYCCRIRPTKSVISIILIKTTCLCRIEQSS